MKHTEKKKGIAALIILAFIFASMGAFVRFLQTDFTILQQTYLRIFAAFFLGLIFFHKDLHVHKVLRISRKDWLLLILRAVSLYVLAVTFISQAYTMAKYSNVSFIGALPTTALLGFLLLREKMTFSKVFYTLLGFFGVMLIAVSDYMHIFSWGYGELITVLSSFFFSLSYISRKWQSDFLNNKEIAVLIFFLGSVFLLLTSLFFQEGLPSFTRFSLPILSVLLLAGIFNVANLFLTNYGFQKVEAILASNLLTLETVFAILIGLCLFQEVPTIKELIGGIIIVYSVYKINKLA